MAGRFLDDPRWRRRLKCLLFVVISSLILVAGLSYQWFSDRQAAQTLVFKIFTTLFAVTAWATLLFCIWMNRPYMAPLGEHGKASPDSPPDLVQAARVKNEASELIRRIDAIRLRMPGTMGECAEDLQRPSEVKEAA